MTETTDEGRVVAELVVVTIFEGEARILTWEYVIPVFYPNFDSRRWWYSGTQIHPETILERRLSKMAGTFEHIRTDRDPEKEQWKKMPEIPEARLLKP